MNFIERTLRLIEERGITKNKLLTDLRLGKNSFVDWENRGTIPSGETIVKIADYFGVTTDYLLKGDEPQVRLENREGIQMDEHLDLKELLDKLKSGKVGTHISSAIVSALIEGWENIKTDTKNDWENMKKETKEQWAEMVKNLLFWEPIATSTTEHEEIKMRREALLHEIQSSFFADIETEITESLSTGATTQKILDKLNELDESRAKIEALEESIANLESELEEERRKNV